jgi:hypothetical protein
MIKQKQFINEITPGIKDSYFANFVRLSKEKLINLELNLSSANTISVQKLKFSGIHLP